MSSEVSEIDYLQELSNRHDEVMAKLDELEKQISLVMEEYLGKVEALTQETTEENIGIH